MVVRNFRCSRTRSPRGIAQEALRHGTSVKYALIKTTEILPPLPIQRSFTTQAMKHYQVLQSILIKPLTPSDARELNLGLGILEEYQYQIIKGERVFADAVSAGISSIPCVIIPESTTPTQCAEMRLLLTHCQNKNIVADSLAVRGLVARDGREQTKARFKALGFPNSVFLLLERPSKLPKVIFEAALEGRIKPSVFKTIAKLTTTQQTKVCQLLAFGHDSLCLKDVQELQKIQKQEAAGHIFSNLKRN